MSVSTRSKLDNHMVIGDTFVIGHVPRTGGDVVKCAFTYLDHANLVPNQRESLDDHQKHNPSWAIAQEQNKQHILTFRKLDEWFLSYVFMAIKCGTYPLYRKWPNPSQNDLFDVNYEYGKKWISEDHLKGPTVTLPDRYLRLFVGQGKVDRYLRVEHLFQDTVSFVESEGVILDDWQKQDLADIFKRPVPYKWVGKHCRDPYHHWPEEKIALLYRLNPKWALCEKIAYEIPLL